MLSRYAGRFSRPALKRMSECADVLITKQPSDLGNGQRRVRKMPFGRSEEHTSEIQSLRLVPYTTLFRSGNGARSSGAGTPRSPLAGRCLSNSTHVVALRGEIFPSSA